MGQLKYILIFTGLALLLFGREYFFYRTFPIYRDGQHVKFETMLSQEPKLVSGKQRFTVQTPDGIRAIVMMHASPLLQIWG